MGEKSAGSGRGRRARGLSVRRVSLIVAAVSVVALIALANMAAATPRQAETTAAIARLPVSTPEQPAGPAAAAALPDAGVASGASVQECNYTISLDGSIPVARGDFAPVRASGADIGAFLTGMLASHETVCLGAGDYSLTSPIEVNHLEGVTLSLAPGAVVNASSSPRFLQALLLVNGSPGTTVKGGQWVGPGKGKAAVIRIESGSNSTAIEGANVSEAGWDGILVYDSLGPSFGVTISGDLVHNNGRYGIQEYSNDSVGPMGTLISDNAVLDNKVGGIYTNGVGGVSILQNVVANSVGTGPGLIGIGVTNGNNDTVSLNRVSHMEWFGIQAYYNNDTTISDNLSTSNAGGEDQSGITNDHSSFDTITGNTVESNGRYGIYVERSWNVTVADNVADSNFGYGIALNHGTIAAMGRTLVTGNSCSYNSLGGIILNSAVDDSITMNQCTNNPDGGIILYNDPGQAASSGNLVADNLLGNVGNSTQTFGIVEDNQSFGNALVSNVMEGNSVAPASLVGPDANSDP